MLKILHIGTDKQWRGGENQIRLLIIHSAKNEYEHHVAYPETSQALVEFEKCAPVCSLPSRNGVDPRSIYKIVQYCKDNDIDVIDVHSSTAMSLALSAKRWLPQVKLVVHRRVDFPIKTGFFTRRKYMSRRISKFVAISDCIRRRLISYGIESANVELIPSAIDESRYAKIDSIRERTILMQKARLTPDTTMIGIAAAITGEKGHDILLKACHRLLKQEYLFHCFVAGDGAQTETIKKLAEELGLQKRVTFLGHVNYVPGFLAALDILAVPSESEGLGTIVLEGIAASCAIVATRVGGIPEMIIHGETGLLCEKGDDEGLSKNLIEFIEKPELRQKLNQNAKEHISRNFSLKNMVEKNLELYKKISLGVN